jgi:hypothetical protein
MEIYVVADAAGAVSEMDESNNSVQLQAYVYPVEMGFPVKMSDDVEGHVITDLDGDGKPDILVTSGGTQAQAIGFDGSLLWLRDDLGLPQWFSDIQPTAFDLNGDGAIEAIVTTRSGVLVAEGATGSTIWKRYTDYPVVSPIVSDIDGDGSYEVLHGTFSFNLSMIYAYSASGAYEWVYEFSVEDVQLTGMIVCDIDLDSYKEVIFSGDDGSLKCLTCSENPPGTVWETFVSPQGISWITAGDLERDGTIEVVAGCGDSVYVVGAAGGGVVAGIECPGPVSRIALGDLEDDGDLEIVCTSGSGLVFRIDDGVVTSQADIGNTPIGSPVLVDIDRDGLVETILASEEGWVRILEDDGTDHIPPVPMRGLCKCGPSVCDLDEDGNIEIVAGSTDSLLFMLDLGDEGGRIEWCCDGGGITRPGLYAQPLFGAISDQLTVSGRIDAVGDVVVDGGAVLVLDRSTDLRAISDDVYSAGPAAGLCEIIVNGSLYATGTSSAGVSLRPISVPHAQDAWAGVVVDHSGHATLSKISISGAVIGVECHTSDVNLSECTISDCLMGIKLDEASPLLDHNTITRNDIGISVDDACPVFIGNMIVSNISCGLMLSNSSDAILDDNVLRGTSQGSGLACYSSSPSILPRNEFDKNSLCGIYLSNSSPLIDSCSIAYNGDCGVKATYYSEPAITKTSIYENAIGVGVYVYSNPALGDTAAGPGGLNDIRQNTEYAINNETSNEIRAQGNWWGVPDPDPSIFSGPVDYSGWLDMSPAGVNDTYWWTDQMLTMHPNPFRGVLRIRFSVTKAQVPASLRVYDIRGRLIRDIALATTPGETYLEWDGTDDKSRPVASGTYLLRTSWRTGTHTRKVILLR